MNYFSSVRNVASLNANDLLERSLNTQNVLTDSSPLNTDLTDFDLLGGNSGIPSFITVPPDTGLNNHLVDSLGFVFTDSLALDSLLLDSLAAADSVKKDPRLLDSTARLEHFKVKRSDVPYISFYKQKPSGFFIEPSVTNKKRVIQIDSTGKFVEIRDKIGEQTVKVILKVPLEDYINYRLKARERTLWDDLAYKYELKDTAMKGLGELIKSITDFEIPLPSVGVLTIFGTPKISLQIGGAVDIHGAWRTETTEGVTASALGNTRNEPDFRQTVQVNVNGMIGDKLQIGADWNTERTFEYENQLKIKYTGYEDEIIQSIEAGNVSLQTSSLIGGGEALFCIKARFKMGPLTLTTIASQKKGETKEKSLSGGSQSTPFTIRAYDYSKNHYFIDSVYADTSASLNLFNKYYANAQPVINSFYTVKYIEVWKSVKQALKNPNERNANAFIHLPQRSAGYDPTLRSESVTDVEGQIVKTRFILLQENIDYILHKETGYITFKTRVEENEVIAVAYQIDGPTAAIDDDIFYGDFIAEAGSDTSQRMILKLVKPENLQPSYTTAWQLLLKNIYPLGPRNINKDGFELDIKYDVPGQELQSVLGSVKLLNAFGLDYLDAGNNPNPDGLFDFLPDKTIIPETGEVIFPVLQPFGRSLSGALSVLPDYDSLRYNDVYDKLVVFAKQNQVKDKWVITGKSSGSSSSTYSLGFNLVENSVKVLLNGRELTPGVDYYIDYNVGQLTIRNDAALVPGANLKITYEENDLYQFASKTLFGMRGEIDFSKRTKLGFTALSLTQQTLSDKVRIGDEPLSNAIYGMDFSTSADLPFLTKALDYIFSTREMSTISLRGEFAYMNPDPNTKKSTIESDNGKSIAYIDDFEASKTVLPIGISYTSWKDLSTPNKLSRLTRIPSLPDSSTIRYKGKSWWFNILPSDVDVNVIWPDKSVAKSDQQITVLDYVFNPVESGTYNYNPIISDPSLVYGGMMKTLSSTASNLEAQNIEFIEFWMQAKSYSPGTKIYIDLGKISEDVIPNGELNTEDINRNDLIDEGEDLGIDGLNDAGEQNLLPLGVQLGDPSGDNFFYVSGAKTKYSIYDFKSINGTQGNAALTDVGRFPDTEDLNRNGTLDQLNSYFRYEIPIEPDSTINPYIVGGGNEEWFLYRIPLKDFRDQVGTPSLSFVEFVRLFITGTDSLVHLRITELNLVGNQWRKIDKEDEVLSISVINIEDNPKVYQSPQGVGRERDRSRPDEEIYRNEQSLNLILKDLKYGDKREAYKDLPRPLDVFNYSEMKLFLHGDQETKGLDVYFKFGADSNNFYEYRQILEEGWNDEVSLVFSKITSIKQARDTGSTNTVFSDTATLPTGKQVIYSIKGNPSLTNIKFLSIGIMNKKNPVNQTSVSGEIWVNELRVIGADDTPGWAYSGSTSIKFADILTLNLNLSQTDPFFHRLADRFGSRVDQRAWGVSVDANLLKFIPLPLTGSNLRLNYSHTESVGKPLYMPQTDIRVEEAVKNSRYKTAEQIRMETQSVTTSDSWTLSGIKLVIPIEHWFIRDTFNSLTYNFNYNKSFSRSPSVESNKSWIWNAGIAYGVNISQDYHFYPADVPVLGSVISLLIDYRNVKLYYTPQNFTWNITAKRSKGTNITRPINNNKPDTTTNRDFSATRGFTLAWKFSENGFLNLSANYSVDVNSSLTYLETDERNLEKSEKNVWRDIVNSGFFGRDYSYSQTLDFRTSPRIPTLWDLNKFFTLNMGYNVQYSWQNDFRQEVLGRSAGFRSGSKVSLTLRLKALTAPLFAEDPEDTKIAPPPPVQNSRVRNFEDQEKKEEEMKIPDNLSEEELKEWMEKQEVLKKERETLETTDTTFTDSTMVDTTNLVKKPSVLKNALMFMKTLVKIALFDYESISINFSNDNSYSAGGLKGTLSGFSNFWGIKYDVEKGPSRLYMLGLGTDIGPRAHMENSNLTDNYTQKNSIDFKTSKPLWEGAKIDLNWKIGWDLSKSTQLKTNDDGSVSIQNISSSGKIERSFITLPPVLLFSMFDSGIKKVHELYNPDDPDAATNLSNAFVQGFETLPFLTKVPFLKEFMNYIPRANWRLTWDGLEKMSVFKSFAKRVSMDHSYTSSYSESWKLLPDGKQVTQSQRVSFGFSPLIGLNVTFNELWGGNLSGNLKYGVRSSYDLGVTTKNITETFSREIGFSINYSKTGFDLPLFGIALKNDIEFALSYSNTTNSNIVYEMKNFKEEGTPQDGTVRSTLEPRIKYIISSRVTVSIFYKYSSVTPEGAARIPPSTITEAGLDVRISITQ